MPEIEELAGSEQFPDEIELHRIDVSLTLEGPIVTRTGEPGEPWIDIPAARDSQGRVFLPYSLVKGRVRDALCEICVEAELNDIDEWLGKPSSEGSLEPLRAMINFSDFVAVTPERHLNSGANQNEAVQVSTPVVARIELNPEKGVVAKGMLAFIEMPYGYGEEVQFKGHIQCLETLAGAESFRRMIENGFRNVSNFGAFRTIGFGANLNVSLQPATQRQTSSEEPQGVQIPFWMRFDRPFCVTARKQVFNHFETLECIPGSVIKGAISRLICVLNGETRSGWIDSNKISRRFPGICRNFGKIRFTEARPIQVSSIENGELCSIERSKLYRPIVPPLSLAVYAKRPSTFSDLAREKTGFLIDGEAPKFMPDWKGADFAMVLEKFGWPVLPRSRRVRTQMDRLKYKAKEEMLFSYDVISPTCGQHGKTEKEFAWEGLICLDSIDCIEEQKLIRQELHSLLKNGLPGIGKTDATADVQWLAKPSENAVRCEQVSEDSQDEHVITLQTDALMLPVDKEGNLFEHYASYWKEISNDSMELIDYYAHDELYGGFMSRRISKDNYKPFLLTTRGSVFILKDKAGNKKCATERREYWRKRGINPSETIRSLYLTKENETFSTRTCPFTTENGFGEILINPRCDGGSVS